MLRRIVRLSQLRPVFVHGVQCKTSSSRSDSSQYTDEKALKEDIGLTGIMLDNLDEIMADETMLPVLQHYPHLKIRAPAPNHFGGHNIVVIQPWHPRWYVDEKTSPELQLEECVSLGNTISNWRVIGKHIIYPRSVNKKEIVGRKSFEQLKDTILSHNGVSAVFFGLELLSGIQLSFLERELKMPIYDRFTMVLNIFRHQARTKEAKIQIALAELPYIRSHLREIHESSDNSSTSESLKLLVGGASEKFYHQRLNILKRRESELKLALEKVRKQREVVKKSRIRKDLPTVSFIGYTNCGKTSLIKYLTNDESMVPKNQLFATLDVSTHYGQLPSFKDVVYIDTVGFISRIPHLLVEAFSATLRDVNQSHLIVHVLDVNHPDFRLQYATVIKALETLDVSKQQMSRKITVGNKVDLIDGANPPKHFPKCRLQVSATTGENMQKLAKEIDKRLHAATKSSEKCIRVGNGDPGYHWLRSNSTMLECKPDPADANYLFCLVRMDPAAAGRWQKLFGTAKNPDARKDEQVSTITESNR